MTEIYEDKYESQSASKTYDQLNTPEQIKRGQFYMQRYNALVSEMEERIEKWNAIEKQYKCERKIIEGAPNSFIPLTAPIIDGQIASMMDQNISVVVKGHGLGDQNFSHTGQIVGDFILRENCIKPKIKISNKRYLLFGVGVLAIDFEPDELDGFGLSTIRTPQITKVFVDGNIKDLNKFQKARYVIEEIGYQSIMWARDEFGDDKADYLLTNCNKHDFDGEEILQDEMYSFMYLKVWHRNNKGHNLQLLEMDATGFVLRESDPNTPYYKYVYNRYPYSFYGMYEEEGNFYRFGDGLRLQFLQDTLNKLYDEVITACKYSSQGKPLVDPASEMDLDELNGDPSSPAVCINPLQNVRVLQGTGINPVIERLIQNLFIQAEKVSRFSGLMTGNAPSEQITATQAGIQSQQGNTGINDKKSDVSEALAFALKYAIGLAMEFWTEGQAMRVSDDKSDEFQWIDTKDLKNVPIMIPTDEKYQKMWKEKHPDSDIANMPKFIQYVPEKDIKDDNGNIIAKAGEGQTKSADFDIEVSIGEGMPTNKMARYNIILSLAQLQLPDEQTGQLKPIMGYQQVRKMIEEYLGMPFDDALEEAKKNTAMTPSQNNVAPINMHPSIPGANMGGMPQGGAISA